MEAITTSTTDELRSAVEASWAELLSAIGDARARWRDRSFEAEDETEDAWSPRQIAWHACAGELIRGAYLRHILEERPDAPTDMMAFAASAAAGPANVAALRDRAREVRTVEETLALAASLRDDSAALLEALPETNLACAATLSDFVHEYLRGHGQTGSNDVRGSVLHGVVHLRDHARQLSSGSS